MRRTVLPGPAVLVLSFLVVSCDAAPDALLSPDDAVAGKGGQPGKPDKGDGGTAASSLVEYYVIPSPDGIAPNVIHTVVDGSAAHLGGQIVHDYFFNGIRDYDPHYEYYLSATFDPGSETVTTLPNGHTHIDRSWSGKWGDQRFSCDPDGTGCTTVGVDTVSYTDYLTTEVTTTTGELADPFAMAPRFYDAEGNVLFGTEPQGMVIDGQVVPDVGDPAHHARAVVTSYALHSGEPASVRIGLETLTARDLECSTTTLRDGRGKNRTSRTVTRLSATIGVRFHTSDGADAGYWAELHVRPVDPVPMAAESGGTINGNVTDTVDEFRISTLFDAELSGETDVELVMDYVHGTSGSDPQAPPATYDPGLNTGDGLTTRMGPSTTLNDGSWPEAVLALGSVTCG